MPDGKRADSIAGGAETYIKPAHHNRLPDGEP